MTKIKSVVATDQKELANLRAENEALKIALSIAKTTKPEKKEFSDFFFQKDGKSLQSMNGLSETKRFFENNKPEVLKGFCETLKVEKLTSIQFHQSLSGLI